MSSQIACLHGLGDIRSEIILAFCVEGGGGGTLIMNLRGSLGSIYCRGLPSIESKTEHSESQQR